MQNKWKPSDRPLNDREYDGYKPYFCIRDIGLARYTGNERLLVTDVYGTNIGLHGNIEEICNWSLGSIENVKQLEESGNYFETK